MATMPRLFKLQEQAAKIAAEIEKIKQTERGAVIARILEAVHSYDITREELYGYAGKPLPVPKVDGIPDPNGVAEPGVPPAPKPEKDIAFRTFRNPKKIGKPVEWPHGLYRSATGKEYNTDSGPLPDWLKKAVHDQKHKPADMIVGPDGTTMMERRKMAKEAGLSKPGSPKLAEKANGAAGPHKAAKGKRHAPIPKGSKRPPQYTDGKGNTWTGGGSMPVWMRDAIAQGKSKEDFRITSSSTPAGQSSLL